MDSLRYWVSEMHVDGFRFDLASALARATPDVDLRAPLLTAIAQDPVVSQVKLIAEPWDVGPGGYQVGQFPAPWSEWNGRYRDAVREYWKRRPGRRRGDCVPAGGVERPVSGSRAAAVGLGQLRDLSRRLLAAGPGVL